MENQASPAKPIAKKSVEKKTEATQKDKVEKKLKGDKPDLKKKRITKTGIKKPGVTALKSKTNSKTAVQKPTGVKKVRPVPRPKPTEGADEKPKVTGFRSKMGLKSKVPRTGKTETTSKPVRPRVAKPTGLGIKPRPVKKVASKPDVEKDRLLKDLEPKKDAKPARKIVKKKTTTAVTTKPKVAKKSSPTGVLPRKRPVKPAGVKKVVAPVLAQ